MNFSQEDEQQNNQSIEDIKIYQLIPQAKPVISPDHQYAPEKKISYIIKTQLNNLINKKNQQIVISRESKFSSGFFLQGNFQSGNLQSFRQSKNLYIVKLRSDTNSKHQSQWFYFRAKGINKATFQIQGFRKTTSLFNQGMKICIKQDNVWTRGGTNISYYQKQSSYALKFDIVFKDLNAISQIAYCFPYTYSDLNNYFQKILLNRRNYKLIRKQIIGKSILDNEIFCFTFNQSILIKPIILIMARVHPGQSVSSYLLQGFIDELVSDKQQYNLLLKHFEIKIIPMLNPDGVISGNHRFSYSGCDLNRLWKTAYSKLHPQIYKAKQYLTKYFQRITMVIDLHGHSRKKNVFFYGCQNNFQDKLSRKFPYLMSKLFSNYSYKDCCFRVQKGREGTARIHLWKMLKIPYIYTLECSFCGNQFDNKNYDINDLLQIGSQLFQGIATFFSDKFKTETKIFKKRSQIFNQFEQDPKIFENCVNDSGSDSQPQQGILSEKQILQILREQNKIEQEISQVKITRKKYNIGVQENKIKRNTISFKSKISSSAKSERKLLNLQKLDRQISHRLNKKYQEKSSKVNFFQKQFEKKTKLLNQLRNINTLNMNGMGIEIFQLPDNFKSVRLDNKKLGQTLDLQSNSTNRSDYYGPQYIRVKNYAQKLKKQQQILYFSKPSSQLPLYHQLQKKLNKNNKQTTALQVVSALKSQKNVINFDIQQSKNLLRTNVITKRF